jgi:hypothetical protein
MICTCRMISVQALASVLFIGGYSWKRGSGESGMMLLPPGAQPELVP